MIPINNSSQEHLYAKIAWRFLQNQPNFFVSQKTHIFAWNAIKTIMLASWHLNIKEFRLPKNQRNSDIAIGMKTLTWNSIVVYAVKLSVLIAKSSETIWVEKWPSMLLSNSKMLIHRSLQKWKKSIPTLRGEKIS